MSAVRLLWREFCDLSPATPAVPQPLLPALVAVLILRVALAIVILTPLGMLMVAAVIGWQLPEMAP